MENACRVCCLPLERGPARRFSVWRGASSEEERVYFWQALELIHRRERKNLSGADTPRRSEVLVWLLKTQNKSQPLKDLYRSSRLSEPTVRNCLTRFVTRGFAAIEFNGYNTRIRVASATQG